MVEQRSPKPTVEGSNPSAPAIIKPPFGGFCVFRRHIKTIKHNLAVISIRSALLWRLWPLLPDPYAHHR